MVWLALIAILTGLLAPKVTRWEKRKKVGLIYGPYGLKKARKGKMGTPAEQNHARAQYWKAKYHDAIRQRDEAGVALGRVKKQLDEVGKLGKLVAADRSIMSCDHPHCQRARAIMRQMVAKARGLADVRAA